MNEYTIIVPLKYNNGTEVDYVEFVKLEATFLNEFGGFTNLGIVEGQWADSGVIYRDRSVRYAFATDSDDKAVEVARFVAEQWRQECVYLSQTSTNVRFVK